VRTSDFDYSLPSELIAQTPSPARGDSRLLVIRRDDAPPAPPAPPLEDRLFGDLPALVNPGDLLVVNSTRVRHARLLGTRPSGAPAEVLLIHPTADGSWIGLGQPGSALRPGKRITLGDGVEIETVEALEGPVRRFRFHGATAETAMRRFGRLPLPPYIERDPTEEDDARYQTVYAEREGSVAAPTAGLHFTPELIQRVEGRGATVTRLDLEVGPGTFRPVETSDPRRHRMHPERYEIPALLPQLIARTRSAGGKVWAVGTTVVRALESAAGPNGTVTPGRSETSLMILPGYRFRVVDRLITNFHLPRSTLLMLVSAFAGTDRVLAAYRHAVERGYRFYSYGDATAIL